MGQEHSAVFIGREVISQSIRRKLTWRIGANVVVGSVTDVIVGACQSSDFVLRLITFASLCIKG